MLVRKRETLSGVASDKYFHITRGSEMLWLPRELTRTHAAQHALLNKSSLLVGVLNLYFHLGQ